MMRKKIVLVAMMTVAACGLGAQTIAWQQDEGFFHPAGIPTIRSANWAWGDIFADGRLDVIRVGWGYDFCCLLDIFTATAEGTRFERNEELLSEINNVLMHGNPNAGYLHNLLGGPEPDMIFFVFDPDQQQNAFVILHRDSSGVWQKDSRTLSFLNGLVGDSDVWSSPLFFADTDRDGDADLLVNIKPALDRPGGYKFFRNNGTPGLPVFVEDSSRIAGLEPATPSTSIEAPAILIDADGDGLLDIVQPKSIDGRQQLVYFPGQEDSSGTFWAGAPVAIPFAETRSLHDLTVYDFNADGRDDLFSGRYAQVFLAHEDAPFFENQPYALDLNPLPTHAILPFDFDSDAENEILLLTVQYEFDEQWRTVGYSNFYELDTLGRFPAWHRAAKTPLVGVTSFTHPYLAAELTDLDRDGKPELSGGAYDVLAPGQGTLFSFQFDEPDSAQPWQDNGSVFQHFLAVNARGDTVYSLPAFADMDGDGREDMLLRRSFFSGPDSGGNEIVLFRNLPAGDELIWQEQPAWTQGLPDSQFYRPALTDLDLDGDADLVFYFGHSHFAYYENSGSATAPLWQMREDVLPERTERINWDLGDGILGLNIEDFDGDNDDDIFVINRGVVSRLFRNQLITRVSAPSRQVLPGELHLQAWPNPIVRQGRYSFSLRRQGRIGLRLYNVIGQVVRVIEEGHRPAGEHSGVIRVESLPSGLYFLRLTAGGSTVTRPLMIVR